MKKKVGKVLLTIAIVLAAIVVLYVIVNAAFIGVVYPDFIKNARPLNKIPDMLRDFIPQGVTSLENKLLVCGYSTGSAPSRIYLLDDRSTIRIDLNRENGEVYTGHAGGMSCHGDFVYISNASKIFVLRAEDILKAANGSTATMIGYFEVPCRSSFCSCDGEFLYVGEYHADGYETSEDHVIDTADGKHAAMVFCYKIDGNCEYGVQTDPEFVYSVCDIVQGFAVKGTTAVASCSSGLANSELKYYDVSGQADSSFKYGEKDLPMYILDSKRLTKTVTAPHMSEDLEFTDRGLLVAFEAGAKKYGGGILPFSLKTIMLISE